MYTEINIVRRLKHQKKNLKLNDAIQYLWKFESDTVYMYLQAKLSLQRKSKYCEYLILCETLFISYKIAVEEMKERAQYGFMNITQVQTVNQLMRVINRTILFLL